MTPFDPRVTLAREDLTAADLEGLIAASRYAPRRVFTVVSPSTPLLAEPGGAQEDALVFGETFDVLEERGAMAWGQARRDGYVGWVDLAALREGITEPTHRVLALHAEARLAPEAEVDLWGRLPMNALVTVAHVDGDRLQAAGAGWIDAAALAPMGSGFARDPVAVAECFLGVPYLWGGRDADGLDCSGLVQQALYACGRGCPRDADQQEAALGRALGDKEPPLRGDLVFWDGHVGWLSAPDALVHAAGSHGRVVVEPLASASERIAASGAGQPRFRRL